MHVFAQREAGKRSEGWEEECHLHCGRGCLGGRTSATYLRQKGHRHHTPRPLPRSDSDSHARARRSDKAAEETDFPFAEAAEEHAR